MLGFPPDRFPGLPISAKVPAAFGRQGAAPNPSDEIPTKPLKTTDPLYAEHVAQLAKAKATKQPQTIDTQPLAYSDLCDPPYLDGSEPSHVTKAKRLGCELAQTTGGQIVMIGENHDQTAQWEVTVGLVEGLRTAGDLRPIIFVDEAPPAANTNATYTAWRTMTPDTRQKSKGHFADHLGGARELYIWRGNYELVATQDIRFTTMIPQADALNRISALAPELMAYNADINNDVRPGPEHYADRDTAEAITIAAIRKNNPDAIIIVRAGSGHVSEYIEDNPSKPTDNINENGRNMNDPLGEQLALLYGNDHVHTICAVPRGRNPIIDSKGNECPNPEKYIDAIIRIPARNPKVEWIPPAEWAAP